MPGMSRPECIVNVFSSWIRKARRFARGNRSLVARRAVRMAGLYFFTRVRT